MSFDLIKVALDGVALILSVAAIVIAFFRTRQSKVDERFKKGSDVMDRHELRLSAVEQTVRAMPGREDIHKIELGMSEMRGLLSRMEAVMEGNSQIMSRLEAIVSRHENHLLERS